MLSVCNDIEEFAREMKLISFTVNLSSDTSSNSNMLFSAFIMKMSANLVDKLPLKTEGREE